MNKRWKLLVVAAAVSLALALGSVFWSQSNSAPAVQTKVSFHMDSDFGSALIRVAKAEGIFTKYGIDASLHDFPDGISAINGVLASPKSEIALATSSGASLTSFAPVNKDIKIISQLANNEDNYYWVVKKGKGNETVEGLKGLKIGFPAISGYRTFLQLSLRDHGLTSKDVTLVPMEASQFADAMAAGNIDAHPSRVLVTQKTFRALNGRAYELHDVGAYDWFNVLSTTTANLRNHKKVLVSVLKALLETQSSSYLKPEAARLEVAKSLKITVTEVPKNVIDYSNIRLSNGLLRQLNKNRVLLSADQGFPSSDYFSNATELIDAGPLTEANPLVVHIG